MTAFALVIAASMALQEGAVSQRPMLGRMYALGEAGDHDGDGVQDLAITGLVRDQPEGPMVVRIFSGANFGLIVEHVTPARRGCSIVLHEPYVRLIDDLDGDGLREIASNQGRGVLLDGATGRTLRDFGADTFVWGLVDDAEWFGARSLGVFRNVRWRCGAGELSNATLERRSPNALDESRAIWGVEDSQRVAAASNATGDKIRGPCGEWGATLERIEIGVDRATNVIEHVELALRSRDTEEVRWRQRFEFELADAEWGAAPTSAPPFPAISTATALMTLSHASRNTSRAAASSHSPARQERCCGRAATSPKPST